MINQPYVPQTLQSSLGTSVFWFNGDVGHDHELTVLDKNSKEVFSENLHFNQSSAPLLLNETGRYTYSESNVNTEDPAFVMEGFIDVKESLDSGSNGNNVTSDTLALFMVPSKDLFKHINTSERKGIDILGQFMFDDLRGSQNATGDEQLLLLLGSMNGVWVCSLRCGNYNPKASVQLER